MLLKAYNRVLIKDNEKTYLTAAAVSAATSLTVQSTDLAPAATSSDTWEDNDYMIVGEIGQEGTEVMQVNGAVTTATGITIDRSGEAGGLRYDHSIGTPVYRVSFNRVEFSQNSSDTTTGATVLTTIRIQPDDEFTRYNDTTNTTGYGFIRLNNETSNAFSSYSDGVNYEVSGIAATRDPRTLNSMENKVRKLLDEREPDSKLTDEEIEDALDDKQKEIAHQRLWSFFENTRSFSLVADQFAYDLPVTVQKIHAVKVDTQPLVFITQGEWNLRHWDTNETSGDATHYGIWNGQLRLYPRPSAADSTTTLGAAISSTTATSITVASSSGFNRGDYYRFIIDSEVIYATASTSTTFTGCLRGREGTTAATHSNGATVTERSIVYDVHVEPDKLVDSQQRTAIPEPDVLTYGAAIDLAPLVGKEGLIATFESKYERRMKSLRENYSSKQTVKHGRVKDMNEVLGSQMMRDPRDYPQDVG